MGRSDKLLAMAAKKINATRDKNAHRLIVALQHDKKFRLSATFADCS